MQELPFVNETSQYAWAISPDSSILVHFWYMDVRRVGVLTFNMRILSTRESNTRSVCSLSSSSWQRILQSMKEANICVSRKRDRNGRYGSGWSDRKEACSGESLGMLHEAAVIGIQNIQHFFISYSKLACFRINNAVMDVIEPPVWIIFIVIIKTY